MSLDTTLTATAHSRLPAPSGDVVHLEVNFEEDTVPSLNTDQAASIASMERVKRMIATYRAKLFINHDKAEFDALKLIPAFYD